MISEIERESIAQEDTLESMKAFVAMMFLEMAFT